MVSLLAAAKLSKNETMAMITTAILYHPSGYVFCLIFSMLGTLLLMSLFLPCFLVQEWWSRYSETFSTETLTTTKPAIVTHCTVYETNVPWYRQKQVIWRETKHFEFAHWVDVTDPNMNLDYHSFLTASFEIDFADDETERAYQEHVKEMLEDLPEYCQNAEKVIKTIKVVGGKKQILYQTTRVKAVLLTLLVTIPVSFVTLPLLYLSNTNIEVLRMRLGL